MLWDVFISHASEDKETVARPLAARLEAKGLRVWIDEQQLFVGDSLSSKINDGLAFSQFGIVILSSAFLDKDYPLRELQALLARQTAKGRYILPVLHNLSHSELKNRVPLVSDFLAVSTDRNLDIVASELFRSVRNQSSIPVLNCTQRYFEEFTFPEHLIAEALGAIITLESPHTYQHLQSKRDMSDPSVWMGTDAEVLVSLTFQLYAPLVHFHKLRYRLERSLTTLSLINRFRFGLLDSALRALGDDAAIAAADPRIKYTPRCSGWRHKRTITPQQFWWQGLTDDRFEAAMFAFYADDEVNSEPRFNHFRRTYGVAYSSVGEAQQTIGLIANALYNFRPTTRPVYWRMLRLWKRLYLHLKVVDGDQSQEELLNRLTATFQTMQDNVQNPALESELAESLSSTNSALLHYYQEFVRPKIRTYML